MKSSKQRRAEIQAQRASRAANVLAIKRATLPLGAVACNPERLAPSNSYGVPEFVVRGYYVDQPFVCRDCGVEEIWRAAQQKWWYESAGGNVESRAARCNPCRRRERERKNSAREVQQRGAEAKAALHKVRFGGGIDESERGI